MRPTQSWKYWTPLLILVALALAAAPYALAQTDPVAAPTTETIWTMARWSPYVVGALIGLLCCLAFVLSAQGLGASYAYSQMAGLVEQATVPSLVKNNPYYTDVADPRISWQVMLLLGVAIGAFLSSWLSGTFTFSFMPQTWTEAFGPDLLPRWLAAFFGAACLAFGARWADGCTSGHGITGTMLLNVSSFVAVSCFFAGGVAVALILYS